MYVYVLELTSGKYYVGKFDNLKNTTSFDTIPWIYSHQITGINSIFPYENDSDIDKYTIQFMTKYGINNVRGGSFSDLQLDDKVLSILRIVTDCAITISNTNANTCINTISNTISNTTVNSDEIHISNLLNNACICDGQYMKTFMNKKLKTQYIHNNSCSKIQDICIAFIGRPLHQYLLMTNDTYLIFGKYALKFYYNCRKYSYCYYNHLGYDDCYRECMQIMCTPQNKNDLYGMERNMNIYCDEIDIGNEIFVLYKKNSTVDITKMIDLYLQR